LPPVRPGKILAAAVNYPSHVAGSKRITGMAEVPPEQQGDDSAAVNTVTLTEKAGRTTATMLSEYPSQEIRDMVIQSGMEAGMQDAMDLLEEVAVSLA